MEKELQTFYEEYKQRIAAYQLALNTMYYDQATIAPKNGAAYANQAMSILSGERFSYATDPQNLAKLNDLYETTKDPLLKRELTLLLNDLNEEKEVPKDFYIAYHKAVSDSETAWYEAKEKNDYEIFKPHLKKVITMQKQMLEYSPKRKTMMPYNLLLDRFEEGMNEETYDAFFQKIKDKLVPFIKKITQEGKKIDASIFNEHYKKENQAAFLKELQKYMQVNLKECYLGESEHPFTESFSSHDARITTHYYENNLLSSIFSFIHEYGHALFGLQIEESFEGSTLADRIGMAMHESQSRFMENHIGRHPAFWKVNYPKLQKQFPSLTSLSYESFMEMIHVAQPSLIRTEADELTYPLHILIRYEIEKMIFHEGVDFDELPKIWADKYEEYLGIRPASDREGILQDVHWGGASFGYFPTYALGSAFAAQFYHAMEEQINVEEALLHDFQQIREWLKENIHHYGASKSALEILISATKESFNPDYYIDYLINKYTKIYQLQ